MKRSGINIIGYISGNLGAGVAARSVVQVIVDRNIPVSILDINPGQGRQGYDSSFQNLTVQTPDDLPHQINLFILPPLHIVQLYDSLINPLAKRVILNAAFPMWELTVIPPTFVTPLQKMDVLIAGSHFICAAFASNLSGVFQLYADHPLFLPQNIIANRSKFALPDNTIVYFTSFEPFSDPSRKNVLGVLHAFMEVESYCPNSLLLIKVNNAVCNSELHPAVIIMQQLAANSSRIRFILDTLSYDDLLSLYASCDIFVSLHRAEGLGLGMMEAMSLGKPVIATAWSGNMSFMDHNCAALVGYTLVPVESEARVYSPGFLGTTAFWADAHLNEAVDWMRRLYYDSELRRRLGCAATAKLTDHRKKAAHASFVDELFSLYEHKQFAAGTILNYSKKCDEVCCSIIIPTFNNLSLTIQCLQALNTTLPTNINCEIIIVDNASIDGTHDYLKNITDPITLISNTQNLGFSNACNQGAQAARGKFLLFLNNDTIPQDNWLKVLVDFISTHPDAGIVGSKLLYPDDTIQHCGASMCHDGLSFRHQYKFLHRNHPLVNSIRELDAVTAACFITPRDLFTKLGGFDEQYLNGCEDMDYCTAVRNAGYKIYYNPGSELYHLESQTPRPHNRDNENFARYVSKWGAWRMKNEIVVYADDGFWVKTLADFTPTPHAVSMIQEITKGVPQQIADEIAGRIFPVMQWRKPAQKSGNSSDTSFKLKILFVCHDFPPYKLAGAQLFALKTAQELIAMGHDVRVFYPVNISTRNAGESHTPYQIRTTSYDGLPVYQITVDDSETSLYRHPQNCFEHPQVENAFRTLLTEEAFDIVHFHLLYRLSTRLPLITKELRVPSVATLHDYWLLCAMGHLLDTTGRECTGPESPEKCATCFNGFMQQPAPDIITFFRKRCAATKVGYEAIDIKFSPSSFLAGCHAQYGFTRPEELPLGWIAVKPAVHQATANKRVVFGYLGQIIERKGLDLLLTATAQLHDENWELRIYGEVYQPDYFAPLNEYIKKHPRIYYCGPFNSCDLEQLYADIHVAVVPSRQENYPLTVLEALSAQVPVIATNVGGVREIVQNDVDGIIVPPHDPVALCAAMERFIVDPKMAQNMRETIRPVKTIGENAKEYERVYRFLSIESSKNTMRSAILTDQEL